MRVLFFWESTTTAGNCPFVIGSAELAVRPSIRLGPRVNLKRIHDTRRTFTGSDQDF